MKINNLIWPMAKIINSTQEEPKINISKQKIFQDSPLLKSKWSSPNLIMNNFEKITFGQRSKGGGGSGFFCVWGVIFQRQDFYNTCLHVTWE